MKEEQMIAKITKDTFKKRELRFTRIEKLEKSKNDLEEALKIKKTTIDAHVHFRDTCHSLSMMELYHHPLVVSSLMIGLIEIYHLSHFGLKWEPWVYNAEEYIIKVERGELIFYIPVKKQMCSLIDNYNKHHIQPIIRKINVIDRRIERTRQELSAIQSIELHKIKVEEAFLNKKYVFIFRELNMLIYSVSQSIENVVKHKYVVSTKHLNICIQMMRRFNEERMFIWLTQGTEEKYYNTQSINNTYRLLPPIFKLLMRMEKLVKTRIRRNTIYIQPQTISSFVKEINLFKKHHNKIWISFYTSTLPYILKNNNFSDILVQHIYEYVYGEDKPIEYSYKRRMSVRVLPQPGTLTA
jgi:hypothetical protein